MGNFKAPRSWPFERGIHRSPVNSPHKGQWRGALKFFLISAWTNGWVNNRDAGDLRRHCVHRDVLVMVFFICPFISGRSRLPVKDSTDNDEISLYQLMGGGGGGGGVSFEKILLSDINACILCGIITHSFTNNDSDLTRPPLKIKRGWIITCHNFSIAFLFSIDFFAFVLFFIHHPRFAYYFPLKWVSPEIPFLD